MTAHFFGIIVALALATGGPLLDKVVAVYGHAADVNAACFTQAPDNTTYVNTGDIDAMWLRDSSAQAMSYLRDRRLVRGVIARQERMIALDPYANAFRRDYSVAEEKFELDSLSYPVRLVDRYTRATGDTSVFDERFHGELQVILRTMAAEQDHHRLSRYHRNEQPVAGNIGLIWSAYRPSDDPQAYNYNIPENMFAAVTLTTMADMLSSRYHDDRSAHQAAAMATRIEDAITRYAIFKTRRGQIYAYEIDGLGHAKFMDDANVPSLLSTPLLAYPYDRGVYANTRRFVLSAANPYYYRGRFAEGVGSSHTPPGYVWPMSLVVQYRTSDSTDEQRHVVRQLSRSNAGDGALHESFDVNDPKRYTRVRFGWVNALFDQTFRVPTD
jgi:meiotically up-regulated gene 157 (Mug157) protein